MKKKIFVLLTTLFLCCVFTLGLAACTFIILNSQQSLSSEENFSKGLSYELLDDDTYQVSGIGDCTDTKIVIPNRYNKKAVTSIGENAFYNCQSLTSLTIPDSVTSISTYAFGWCDSLTSITIPESVTSIGDYAFFNCKDLTSLTIPDSVTSIGDSAFENCTGLTSVEIPEGVTSIGNSAFLGCRSLTNITIPEGVTSIGENAFLNCNELTSVTILGNVTSIGNSAFLNCDELTSVTILGNVTSIGENAFKNCESLTGVYISNIEAWCNISFDGFDANPLAYAGNLYLNNELIAVLEIPDGIKSIGDYAFVGCRSLTSVTIGGGIKSIGDYAFENCTGLTSVEISSGVTSMGNRAFYGCRSLTIYCKAKSQPRGWNSDWNYGDRPVVWNCNNNDVASDGYVYVVSDGLRYGLKDGAAKVAGQPENITTAKISENVTYKGIEYPVTSIDEYAFSDCENFEFNEYGSTKYVGSKTNDYFALIKFKENSSGTYKIHNDTKIIADSAFQWCHNVERIEIPNGVISIGSYAFYECDRLWDLTIGGGVTFIGDFAFALCRYVTRVTIPDGVTFIGDYVFYYCRNLTSITFNGTIEEWDGIEKGNDWNYNVSATKVVCSDGEVSL